MAVIWDLVVADFPPPAILAALPGLTTPPALTGVALERLAELDCDRLVANLLGPEEQRRYRGFRFEKRQREWLAGRLAAKAALARYWGKTSADPATSWLAWQINADPDGRPLLSAPADCRPVPQLSISHSHGLAVALVAPVACGIDIQQLTATLLKVRPRFATPAEETLLADCPTLAKTNELNRLGLLWAAKEALRKAVVHQPLLGFLEMRLAKVSSAAAGQALRLEFTLSETTSKQPAVLAWPTDQHVVAVTLIN